MFITGILKGMWVTIRTALFRKNVTLQYPKERRNRPCRGLQKVNTDICVVCGMCARTCPIDAIKIEQKPGCEKTRNANDYNFTVNTGSCMWCGLCEEVCPKHAIHLTNTYEMADYTKDKLIRKINL
ncbi:MAG: NADH-quinone oxidoreductase subunit I [Candidatus Altiarchaeales archaeon HGW-Altiarchaeales-1]|nr:MAG: NADH-quinone oxidoreductase subunit I [Candidatus Altiarchaeales archaeon HGW-Altiarchaeales-1]